MIIYIFLLILIQIKSIRSLCLQIIYIILFFEWRYNSLVY